MPRSLSRDISVQELQSMRENGMTNRDIASSLGVSLNTVYKYIGPQHFGTRKEREYRARRQGPPVFQEEVHEEPEDAALIVDNRVIGLVGLFAGYKINVKTKEVAISVDDGGNSMVVPFDQIETFSKELRAIGKHVDGLHIGAEAW